MSKLLYIEIEQLILLQPLKCFQNASGSLRSLHWASFSLPWALFQAQKLGLETCFGRLWLYLDPLESGGNQPDLQDLTSVKRNAISMIPNDLSCWRQTLTIQVAKWPGIKLLDSACHTLKLSFHDHYCQPIVDPVNQHCWPRWGCSLLLQAWVLDKAAIQ